MIQGFFSANSEDKKVEQVDEPVVVYSNVTQPLVDNYEINIGGETPKLTGLRPIIKWPGGKERELKFILPNMPHFQNYYEPFVGGGSVFMSVKADRHYVNDLSLELITLYRAIASQDLQFFSCVEKIDQSWDNARLFLDRNHALIDLYADYRQDRIDGVQLKRRVEEFCRIMAENIRSIVIKPFCADVDVLIKEMNANLIRKLQRMRSLERSKHALPEADVYDNIEAAIKSALYMYYRHLYNIKKDGGLSSAVQCSLFFFIRNYAYSGMFRYSSSGKFNVPYGGIAYNRKSLNGKLSYYQSPELKLHFKNTDIFNLDFEQFLRVAQPSKKDFLFLDPPYDTEFSTYAQNTFDKEDQIRLSKYLLSECPAKWMLVIKHTDFIYDLYNKEGINIRAFEKEYLVSFMNRNDKKAIHLMITNY